MLKYFATFTEKEECLVVYERAHQNEFVSVMDCPTMEIAMRVARELNDGGVRRSLERTKQMHWSEILREDPPEDPPEDPFEN